MHGPRPISHDVVERLRAGDERALEEIMRVYQDPLQTYARRMVGSVDAAADVVQNVFVHVWESRGALHVRGSLRAYMFRAVRNAALNLTIEETARARRQGSVAVESEEDQVTPEDIIEQGDFEAAVRQAIGELPLRCREIFILVRRDGLSYPETAEALGVSLSTVKTQMGRAMATLAARLAPFLRV